MGLVPYVQAMFVTLDLSGVTHKILNVDSDADERSLSKANSLCISLVIYV